MSNKDIYIDDIFEGNIDLVGKKLNQGVLITGYIVDGRNKLPYDVIVYKGTKNDKKYAIKLLYDNNIDCPLCSANETMDGLKSLGIQLYDYYLDSMDILDKNESDRNVFLVTELLFKPEKMDIFLMLHQLIDDIFKYKDYMTHCDIKPDNIMCAEDHQSFYFIDYDMVCKKPLLYGYKRTSFTPNFASQSSVINPTLITIKQDIIELVVSAHAIYYGKQFDKSWDLIYNIDEYSYKSILSCLFLYVLKLNEQQILMNDIEMLHHIIDLTKNIVTIDLDISILSKDTSSNKKIIDKRIKDKKLLLIEYINKYNILLTGVTNSRYSNEL